ncbi:MAG: hypothetical protein EA369_08865 [Bradymonadales bacterium]|nr:MAG: hypothetical protein EA369_08865 [Bradymonadales bacterium]
MRKLLGLGLLSCWLLLEAIQPQRGLHAAVIRKSSQSGELVAALRLQQSHSTIDSLNQELRSHSLRPLDARSARIVLVNREAGGQFVHLIHLRPEKEAAVFQTLRELKKTDLLVWVSENYEYEGEAREVLPSRGGYSPNDPFLFQQRYLDIIQARYAWLFIRGSEDVVVAVTDDGVDLQHEDLKSQIWKNKGEVRDGHDSDKNGYVDDIHGWNFVQNNNDPNPTKSFWGGYNDHGTHVAGIIAGAMDNGVGIAGVAPQSRIMPIKFYDPGVGSWSSVMIAESYRYAVDNGARIISTSYNIDSFVGDPIFEAALEFVDQAGAIHFNSAGNNRQQAPKRRHFESLILVCSTETSEGWEDRLSSFSNWGRGIDICAPGSDILSTVPGNRYESMSGTSMATPVAAGVAALIWAANPTWTREQVVAQLYGTTDSIDSLNPRYADGLGAGRVNALRAVVGRARPPQVRQVRAAYEQNLSERRAVGVEVKLQGILARESAQNEAAWLLSRVDYKGNAIEVIPFSVDQTYRLGSNQIRLEVESGLPDGIYRLEAQPGSLYDPFFRELDGNRDGKSGGRYHWDFEVSNEVFVVAAGSSGL